jgi:putative acetyltransferase
MLTILRTDFSNSDFVFLIKKLDQYLATTDGDEHVFYNQFNSIDKIKNALVIYEDQKPVACGAIKEYSAREWEVKRMYVVVQARGQGLASKVLNELEKWAKELNVKTLILETGKRQYEAIALYHKKQYLVTENFGQYQGVENSVCFAKTL